MLSFAYNQLKLLACLTRLIWLIYTVDLGDLS